MPAPHFSLSEADLHALVDGSLESERRADVLRRAACSATDRDKIEAWQEQADLIRAAFRGVEREPLPLLLDVRRQAKVNRLQLAPSDAFDVLARRKPAWGRLVAGSATMLIVVAGLAGSWIVGGFAPFSTRSAGPTQPEALISGRSGGNLVHRLQGELVAEPGLAILSQTSGLPTTSIPDLTSVGFTFSSAEAQPGDVASVVFRYQNAAAERIVIGVARTSRDEREPDLVAKRTVLTWRAGSNTYAIAGTVQPDRLRAIATSLRADSVEE